MNKYSTVIGIDLGDKRSLFTVLDWESGEEVLSGSFSTTQAGLTRAFQVLEPARCVIEAGGQSRWVSEHLESLGHEVLVANPRKLRMIYDSDDKSDVRDAEMLARLGRVDPKLLYPIRHRGKEAQKHLSVLKARDVLVAARTKLINHVRCIVKLFGHRLPSSSADSFHKKCAEEVPEELRPQSLLRRSSQQ